MKITIPWGSKILLVDDDYVTRFGDVLRIYGSNFDVFDSLPPLTLDFAKYTAIFLDHDLGGEETIRPLVEHLCQDDNVDRHTLIVIHSMNPAGAAWMYARLSRAMFTNVVVIPAAWSRFDYG